MSTEILYAGAGTAKICFPKELFPLEGFSGEIHDDPMARVLLLSCHEQVAIISLDLVMMLPPAVKRIQAILSEITDTKPENVWVHSTHAISTPHQPHPPWFGPKKELPPEEKAKIDVGSALYLEALEKSIREAAQAARAALRPAKMGVGTGESSVNINRDVPTDSGWWTGFNPDGYSNHTATVLRFDDESGNMIAGLVSFGMKACAIDNSEMKQGTRVISSDIPGLTCTLLEERFGAPCLYLMAAACDQVPREMALYDEVAEDGSVRSVDLGVAKGLEIAERLGRKLANDTAAVLESISCDCTCCPISTASGEITWGTKARGRAKPTGHVNWEETGTTQVESLAITIGDVALVALRPEVNAATEKQLWEASPYSTTLMVTMVNGSNNYMPDQSSYDRCTVAAQTTTLMPGAAEAWVAESVRVLAALRAKN